MAEEEGGGGRERRESERNRERDRQRDRENASGWFDIRETRVVQVRQAEIP